MKIFDLIRMCVRNLTRRKFRTFLTVFGVVIGTTSIVIMISLGVGISASLERQMENMGDLSMISVRGQSAEVPLTDDAIAQIQAMPGVVVVFPRMRLDINSSVQMYTGRKDRYSTWVEIIGVYPDTMEKMGFVPEEGDLNIGSDNKAIRTVFGSIVPYWFRDTKKRWPHDSVDGWPDEDGNRADPLFDPMEAEYTLRISPAKEGAKELSYSVKATGILPYKDNDWENMYSMFMDVADLKRIKTEFERENGIKKDRTETEGYEEAKVKVDNLNNVKEVQDAIKAMDFYTSSMEETRETMQQSTQQIQMILGILGAVSLFVAAISITNTMIMSVYERTREIGVMKVLGCLVGNIRTIFLMEAGMIGFLGGCAGIGVSFLLSHLFNTFGGSFVEQIGIEEGMQLSIIPLWLVLTGLAVATSIGLMAGFYPANRAVRISALEAIKQE